MKRSGRGQHGRGLNRLQRLKPPVQELQVGWAEARPSEGPLPRTRREEQASNNLNWVSPVPPLRGLVHDTNAVPPLPRWATLFRPCRDWFSGGRSSPDQSSAGRTCGVSRTSLGAGASFKIRRRAKGSLALGIMSGTSADGIDVALVRVSGRKARLEDFAAFPFPARIRGAILRLGEGRAATAGEISQLNFLLGEVFAEAALAACGKFRVRPSQIALIGSHGQTVFHQGVATSFCGRRVASTLQIGEPSVIAGRTGITTVGDFRPADMAAGGQGAPLVPFVDYLLYRDASVGRAALNIGGIANVTVIPRGAKIEEVCAFDIGPGNMVIDALVRHFTHRRKAFDRDAEMAGRGNVLPGLLTALLRDKYFLKRPPKTAGREQYGEKYVRQVVAHREARRARAGDVIRTVTILTALSIVDAIHRFVPRRAGVSELIVSGGGAHNPLLMAQMEAALPGIRFRASEEFGVPGDAKEAFAFALLGWETLHRRAANVPGATGARKAVVLGKVCYAD
jgi:anhydro-N-acetylmuramic acid kinase